MCKAKDGYTYESDKTCVTEDDCKNTKQGYLFEDATTKVCLASKKDCTDKQNYYVDEDTKKCVTAAGCKASGGHAYSAVKECLKVEPEDDTLFDITDDVYTCKDNKLLLLSETATCVSKESCEADGFHKVENEVCTEITCEGYIYVNGDERKCVTETACLITDVRGIIVGSTCITRDEWLVNPKHYIGLDFHGIEYNGEADVATICANNDEPIEGATLLEGRICACETGMYADVEEARCVTAEEASESKHLKHKFAFNYDNNEMSMDVLVNQDYCRADDGFILTDAKECAAACPETAPAYATDRVCTTCRALMGAESEAVYWQETECVERCDNENGLFVPLSGAEVCVACGPNERGADGQCACMADSALSVDGACVVPGAGDCMRTYEREGEQFCIRGAEICQDGSKLQQDSFVCVQTCDKYEEDEDTTELKCVEDCSHWWYKADEAGKCEEQKWRKNTAIAVPVVVVIVAAAVVVVFFVVKGKGKKTQSQSPLRDNVVTDA